MYAMIYIYFMIYIYQSCMPMMYRYIGIHAGGAAMKDPTLKVSTGTETHS